MTEPSSDLVALGAVEQVKDNAGSLALTWGLRPATVLDFTNNVANIIMDGDTNVIPALSLIGGLPPSARVFAISVPPSGNYIIGVMGITGRVGASVRRSSPLALPDSTFTTMVWDTEDEDTVGLITVPSSTLTVPLGFGGTWAVTATISVAVAPTGINMVVILHNGTPVTRSPFADNIGTSSITKPLTEGDQISVQVYRDGPAATTMTGNLWMYQVRQ